MKYSGDVWGAGAEVLGLLFLLIAAAWQAGVSDWFTKNDATALAYTQTIIQREHGNVMNLLAEIAVTDDPAQRRYWRDEVHKRLMYAADTQRDMDRERAGVWQRQGNAAATIRFWLFFTGAALIVLGKGLIAFHKARKERANQSNSGGGAT